MMKTLIATDVHISVCRGRYYFPSQVSTIIKRYYDFFSSLTLCCRVKNIDDVPSSHDDVTDMVQNIVEIPSLEKALLGMYNKKIQSIVKQCDLVICRCPGIIAFRAADMARKLDIPYFAEVMGCIWDALWNHSAKGKLAAPYMFLKMKQTVCHADYALYVTNRFLQHRYPCKNTSVAASNVKLDPISEDVLTARLAKIQNMPPRELTLATTGAIDVRYKGQEYVIRAIPLLNKQGIRVKYILIGGGNDAFLRKVATDCGVDDQVEFAGRLSLPEVFEKLDHVDIYIHPSLQEGLPRSVIEAMSRACPAIGANTAGIPELIAPECVVKRKSVQAIADTVIAILDSEKLKGLARQNFENAKAYQDTVLNAKRNAYYAQIKTRLSQGQ